MNNLDLLLQADGTPVHFYLNQGRFEDFNETVISLFPHQKNQAICHVISFKTMAVSILNGMNVWLKLSLLNDPVATCGVNIIAGILYAVTVEQVPLQAPIASMEASDDIFTHLAEIYINTFENSQDTSKQSYALLLNKIALLMDSRSCLLPNLYHLLYLCNQLLDLLYNEPKNLKTGDAQWNSSLQDAFDCMGYDVGTTPENHPFAYLNTLEDSIRITNLLHFTRDSSFAPALGITQDALFFYTGCYQLKTRNLETKEFETSTIYFLYSSTSDGPFIKAEYISTCDCLIEYDDYLFHSLQSVTSSPSAFVPTDTGVQATV